MSNAHDVLKPAAQFDLGPRITRGAYGDTHPRRRRKLALSATLLAGDFFSGWIALAVVKALVAPTAENGFVSPTHMVGLLLLIFLSLGLYSGLQCPYPRFRLRGIGVLLFVSLHCFASFGGTQPALLGQAAVEAVLLLSFGFYTELLLRHVLVRAGLWMAPTAVVGCGATAQSLYKSLTAQPELGFKPVGFVCTEADSQVRSADLPGPILCSIEDFGRLDEKVEVAILTSRDQLPQTNGISSETPRLQLILLNDALDIQTLWLRLHPLGNAVGIQLERDPYICQNRFLKRSIDLAVAIPAAILVLPLILALGAIISFVDGGSPLYFQQRIGRGGRTFNVPKLRSMYGDASQRLTQYLQSNPEAREEWERCFKLTNDPRILPFIGNLIRRTSLDELPQLWSIIVGEMSLVGPRPFPQYHISSFDAEFKQLRTMVPPGLTGLWQVTARSDGDLSVQRAQDFFYIRNWSIWLDLYILFQTLPTVISGKGAR